MKKLIKIVLCVILLFFCLMVAGCSWFNTKPTVISNNMYYQTNYNYFCLDGDKTWSQIVVCLKAESDAEKAQNKVTNDLLSE